MHATPLRLTTTSDAHRPGRPIAPVAPTAPTAPSGSPLEPWHRATRQIHAALRDLSTAVHAACGGQPDHREIEVALAEAIQEIRAGLQSFGDWVAQTLRQGNSGAEGPTRARQDALDLLRDARARLLDDELIHIIDHNGFADIRLAATLDAAMREMARRLAP